MKLDTLLTTAAILLCCGQALARPAPASVDAERERVELTLSGYEHVPGKDALRGLSARIELILHDIVNRPSRRVLARSRAIAALQHFPSARTAAVLRELIDRAAAPARKARSMSLALLDLQQALVTYALVVGPASLPLVRPYLEHPLMDLRSAAVRAVGAVRGLAARTLLRDRLGSEPSPMVRHEIKRQLRDLAPEAPAHPRP